MCTSAIRGFHACLVLCYLVSLTTRAVFAEAPVPERFSLSVEDEKLSLDARGASLREVLDTIAAQTGIKVWMSSRLAPIALTESFNKLEFETGLQRLLANTGHVLVQNPARGYAGISDVFVLSVAEPLEDGNEEASQAVETDQRALRPSIPDGLLPPGIRESMLDTQKSQNDSRIAEIEAQRVEVMERLLETLEDRLDPESETIRQLRSDIEKARAQKP